ncbi:pyrroline-5-carboxylate reductase [Collinsella tanakaei]|uniref:pyrroline-5-carboxylate reductase n=1 Tax=Collinsella tanakaei TaxID=626935 RepID=UPI0025A4329A|nr:pyrroline-5-carboxylate reductase [Collinsella tanakaei]MDM8245380.1 pyrroline-5-carboxylate reductase [Collinsella tanakaei]
MAKELALIGCGNMGSAIAKGIVGAGLIAPADIVVSDVAEASQQRLAGELGCAGTCDNVEAVRGAKIVLIAVKPQYLDDVVRRFAPAVVDDALVVSIAAGVTIARLEGLLGEGRKIVRVMPNLPAMVLAGMSSLTPNAQVSDDEIAHVKELFESFGRAEIVPEHLIDAVIAASGSSPAYVCVFIEALADAAVAEGMARAQAYTFAEQAVLGTAKYLLETGVHPAVLKDMVSSPAGTTIEAVAALEAGGMRAAVIDAARAAAAKNRAM